ncbi:MAG: hypothetical protein ACPG51_19435 [Thiolinea sp.]
MFPTVMGWFYYYKHASDQFVSEAHFIIQGSNAPRMDILGALTGVPGAGGGASDAMIIQDYLRSLDFLATIEDELDIRRHYSRQIIDGYARLPYDASDEDFREYWQEMTLVEYDIGSGITTLKMTAFDAETSQQLVELALRESELLINRLSNNVRNDALNLALQEAEEAEQELAKIRAQTTAFREKQNALDPVQEVTTEISTEISARLGRLSQLEGVVSQLTADMARAEAELSELSSFMQPNTVKVKAAQRKVLALRQQVAKAKQNAEKQRRLLKQKTPAQTRKPAKGKKSTAAEVAEFAELQSRQAFAEQLYQAKLATLEQAKMETVRKQRYLTVTVQPSLPDEAIKPDRPMGVLNILLLSFLAWGIGSLSLAAIRDHIGWV